MFLLKDLVLDMLNLPAYHEFQLTLFIFTLNGS